MSDVLLNIVVAVIMAMGYFFPIILGRKRRDRERLFWLNFLLGWTVVGWIVALLWSLREESTEPTHICAQCGSQIQPVAAIKGSFAIELILWLCFLVPGLIYSLWRMNSRYYACPVCKSPAFIPLGTPAANAMLAQIPR